MKTLDELKEAIRAMRQRGHQFAQIEVSFSKRGEVISELAIKAIAFCKQEEAKAQKAAAAIMKKAAKPNQATVKDRKQAHAAVPAFGCANDYEEPVEVAL